MSDKETSAGEAQECSKERVQSEYKCSRPRTLPQCVSHTTSTTRVLIAFTKECVQLEYFSHWLGSHDKYDDDGDIAWLALFTFPD